ncbi:hypothetical protein KEJ13_07570 [Candidatus Bathyarchaeota archaeon]|nr:hypothetical protein [Candidatus Bathyarchaeota archaeon]
MTIESKVTREEFDKLRKSMNKRFSRMERAISNLAEAQLRTEERLEKLTERVEALAEAQLRTEERLEKLTERVEALAEAQLRTEERLGEFVAGLESLRTEVGRLSDTVGFGLEDVARVVLPGWLSRHLEMEVEELRREFVEVEGRLVEVNLYGEGLLKGERAIVVGEVKSRIYGSEVKSFYENIYTPIAEKMKIEVVGVLFGYLIHPSAKKLAEELGLYVIASYER